jgi:hypothetical protein
VALGVLTEGKALVPRAGKNRENKTRPGILFVFMKTSFQISAFGIAFLLFSTPGVMSATPLSTSILYSGRLQQSGQPANGSYDFTFTLFDASVSGLRVANPVTNSAVVVSNGTFSVGLDFGAVFNGDGRWLEVGVRTNGASAFLTLIPRQPVTPTPYALFAPNAGTLSGTPVITGDVTFNPPSGPPFTVLSSNQVANLNADLLDGLNSTRFWQLSGNGGTIAGSDFLGTTDAKPLQLRVNGQTTFQLVPTTNTPNIIGGFQGNYANSNSYGDTIGGGGSAGAVNFVEAPTSFGISFVPAFATISGGANNTAYGSYSTIGGGLGNSIFGTWLAHQDAYNNTIGGGQQNSINFARGCSIGGGTTNGIFGDTGSTISDSTIGGGSGNRIMDSSEATANVTIGGGHNNSIQKGTLSTVISGGEANSINPEVSYGAIGGGQGNQLGFQASYATIVGGQANNIGDYGRGAAIGGGTGNQVFGLGLFSLSCATISGGGSNSVSSMYGTIPGGSQASARSYGQMAYASGQFATNGDAQTSLYVCRATTTNDTQTEIFLDGTAQRMTVQRNSTWGFDILLAGRDSSGNSAVFQIRGAIKNNAGTTALVGSLNTTVLAQDVGSWGATVIADDANDALTIKVTGAASTTIRWVASVRTVEVIQ